MTPPLAYAINPVSREFVEAVWAARGTSAFGDSLIVEGETFKVDVTHPDFVALCGNNPPLLPPRPVIIDGPDLWAEIHGRARDYDGDALAEMAYLTALASRLPGGCGCVKDYDAYLTDHPPQLADGDVYRRWTWELHNSVSARLGKPQLTYTEAAALWGWPTEEEP